MAPIDKPFVRCGNAEVAIAAGTSPNRAIFPASEQIAANDEQQSVLADPTPTRIKLSRRNLVHCTRILETLYQTRYCMIVRCGMERPSCEEQNERYQGEARAARIDPKRESRAVGGRAVGGRAVGAHSDGDFPQAGAAVGCRCAAARRAGR